MNPDISNTPNPNAQSNLFSIDTPITQVPAAPGQIEYNPQASTIQQADDEQLLEELFLAMQLPALFPPNEVYTSNGQSASIAALGAAGLNSAALLKLEAEYEQTKSDIITSIWKNFSKSMEELEERSKEAYIKKWTEEVAKVGPKSGAEYLAYLLALSAAARDKELSGGDEGKSNLSVEFNTAFNHWFSSTAVHSEATSAGINAIGAADARRIPPDPTLDPSFKAGALASNPDAIREVIAAVGLAAAAQLSVSPLADAVTAVGPNTGLPVDSQAAAAMIAALLYGGARNQANIKTLEEAAKGSQPPKDMDFALNFGRQILAIVTHNLEGENELSKERADQNKMIRLMLSVMALNLIYRAGYGGMEGGREFTDLLEEGGTADLDPLIKPLMEKLIAQIKNFLPTEEQARSEMLASLSEYIDSKDSTESMLATSRMFAASLKVSPDIFGERLGAASA